MDYSNVQHSNYYYNNYYKKPKKRSLLARTKPPDYSEDSEECKPCSCSHCYKPKPCCKSFCNKCKPLFIVPYPVPYLIHVISDPKTTATTQNTDPPTTTQSSTTTLIPTTAQTTTTTTETTTEAGETARESRGVTNDVFLELKVQNTAVYFPLVPGALLLAVLWHFPAKFNG
ncbi:unnamed protein product [Diatraea saccharalis]|uniref:Uncharacterized protein n=1 Tax=Diatraea saccharalis TaxID=40085 RepID=A0A9N9R074_9NEOP|nr:unnamed protein product [Diatraea saccharalis]